MRPTNLSLQFYTETGTVSLTETLSFLSELIAAQSKHQQTMKLAFDKGDLQFQYFLVHHRANVVDCSVSSQEQIKKMMFIGLLFFGVTCKFSCR